MKEYTGKKANSGFAKSFGLRYISSSDYVTHHGPLMSVTREGGGRITCEYRNEYGTYDEWVEFEWMELKTTARKHSFLYEGTMNEMSCGEKYTTLVTSSRLYLFYWDGEHSPELLAEWGVKEFSRLMEITEGNLVICADTATLPGSVILDYSTVDRSRRWVDIGSIFNSDREEERKDLPDIDCENKIVSLWDLPLPKHCLRAEGSWIQGDSILILSDVCANGVPIVFKKEMEEFIAAQNDKLIDWSICREGFVLLTAQQLGIYQCEAGYYPPISISKVADITLDDLRFLLELGEDSEITGIHISRCGNLLTLDIQKNGARCKQTIFPSMLFSDCQHTTLLEPISSYSYLELSEEHGSRIASLVIAEICIGDQDERSRFPLKIEGSEVIVGHSACKQVCTVLTDRHLFIIALNPNKTVKQSRRLDVAELKYLLNCSSGHRVIAADSASFKGHILFDVEAEGKTETIVYPLQKLGIDI